MRTFRPTDTVELPAKTRKEWRRSKSHARRIRAEFAPQRIINFRRFCRFDVKKKKKKLDDDDDEPRENRARARVFAARGRELRVAKSWSSLTVRVQSLISHSTSRHSADLTRDVEYATRTQGERRAGVELAISLTDDLHQHQLRDASASRQKSRSRTCEINSRGAPVISEPGNGRNLMEVTRARGERPGYKPQLGFGAFWQLHVTFHHLAFLDDMSEWWRSLRRVSWTRPAKVKRYSVETRARVICASYPTRRRATEASMMTIIELSRLIFELILMSFLVMSSFL